MTEHTGTVKWDRNEGLYQFLSAEDGYPQRLTTAKAGENPEVQELDLDFFADDTIVVDGVVEQGWIYEAVVLEFN